MGHRVGILAWLSLDMEHLAVGSGTLNVFVTDTAVEVVGLARKSEARLLYHGVSFDRFVDVVRYLIGTHAMSCPELGEGLQQ